MSRLLLALTLGTWLALGTKSALADPAAAEALFQEGRKLLEERQVAAACEKFEASYTLEASSGTLLNLAACRAEQGRSATAWAHFVAAERLARTQQRLDHTLEAKSRADALATELSYLTIRVRELVPGLVIARNGQRVAAGSLGARIPVDPGRFVIEASAPGYRPERREVTVAAHADDQVLEIPALLKEQVVPAPPSASAPSQPDREPPPAPASPGPGAAPWIVGGAGLAALAVGGVFGAMALSSDASARKACGQRTSGCPPLALEQEQARDREALISTVGVGVGVVGLGVATWLFLRSGSDSQASDARLVPTAWVGGDAFVFGADGRF